MRMKRKWFSTGKGSWTKRKRKAPRKPPWTRTISENYSTKFLINTIKMETGAWILTSSWRCLRQFLKEKSTGMFLASINRKWEESCRKTMKMEMFQSTVMSFMIYISSSDFNCLYLRIRLIFSTENLGFNLNYLW